jgi:hypothetical protein
MSFGRFASGAASSIRSLRDQVLMVMPFPTKALLMLLDRPSLLVPESHINSGVANSSRYDLIFS